MAKRTKAPAPAASATDTGDDAILAALEQADQQPDENESDGGTKVETADEEIVAEATEDAPVELEEADEEAVLAALGSEEDAAAPKKRSKKASEPKTVVPTREFCDVADHLDPTSLKTTLDGITAKKVSEKAQNLVQAITSGKKLSNFTQLAVKTMIDAGQITSKDLIAAYEKDGKSIGTARAQAQQMMALFKAFQIAAPSATDAKVLVPNDNGLVKELTALAA